MSRIEKTFKALKRPALIPFIMAGDPDYKTSLELLKALPGASADIVELGMPFSDPVADGPVIQKAGQRALKAGANMKNTLKMVREFRKTDQETPLVLMGYANPVFAYGIDQFAKDAAAAGVDGMIVVDLPPEESKELQRAAKNNGLDLVRLITPTTDEARLPVLLKGAAGFLYYVSMTGITGAAHTDFKRIKPHIDMIKSHTDLPLAVGFGIKTPGDVQAVGQFAEAAVIGSALVGLIEENPQNPDIVDIFCKKLSSLAGAP